MKQIRNNTVEKRIIFYLFLFLFSGCTEHTIYNPSTGKSGETRINLSVLTGNIITKVSTQTESTIHQLSVLVFEETNGEFLYKNVLENIELKGGNYPITLPSTDSPVKLAVLANVSDLSFLSIDVDTYEMVQLKLIEEFTLAGPEFIPMFGQVVFNKLEPEQILNPEITLIRSLATLEVTVDASIRNKFKLANVQIYRAQPQINVIPQTENIETDSDGNITKITAPTIPSIDSKHPFTTPAIESVNDYYVNGVYFPEAPYYSNKEDQINEATCMVIGGYYGENNTNQITYYRVDFKNVSSNKFGQVLRNHKYVITITAIESEGAVSVNNAGDNEAVNIQTNLFEWDDTENGVVVGPDGIYISLETNHMWLNYFKGATQTISVFTNADEYTIQWIDENNQPIEGKEIIKPANGEVEGTYFSLEISSNGSSITANTLHTNDTGEERSEKALISVGSIQFVLTLTQQLPTEHERDYINIFSYVGLWGGTLGDEVMGTDINELIATVFRDFLKNTNHFGNHLPFGGFYISGLPASATPMVPRLANLFDIIYIHDQTEWISPNGMNSVEHSQMMFQTLANWLDHSPNRILITTFDNPYIQIPFELNEVFETWNLPKAGTGNTYKISSDLPFFIKNGPFGKVNDSGGITLQGNNYVISHSANPSLTPLIVMESNPDEMVISMDIEKRVIYYANSSFFTNQGLFSANGEIQKSTDILLANLIAWMADTVMGEKLAPDIE